MTPRAKTLLIASLIAIPCLAYTRPCLGHNGRDQAVPKAAPRTYNAADSLSCIEVSTNARTGVRTYTQTCDIPHDTGRSTALAASEPMAHGVDFWVDQSFASGGGGYAPVPPGYEHNSYSDTSYADSGYSDSYISDGYYGYGGYGAYAGYGSGRPGRGHGGHGDHGDGGGGGRPGRPGDGDHAPPASNGGYRLPPHSRVSVPLPPPGVGSPPPYYDAGVGAPPPVLRYNTRGGRRG